jgi:hypothetical protein
MSENFFLTYTNASALPYQGSVLGHHIVLNYIDSDGIHHTLQGLPQNSFAHNTVGITVEHQCANSLPVHGTDVRST